MLPFPLRQALDEIMDFGLDPNKVTIMVDVDASEKFRQWRVLESPSITRTRAKSGGWYLSTHNRRTCTEELMKLQGMKPESVGEYTKYPRTEINAAVGNAMSVNVLERLLPRVAFASGAMAGEIPDKWLDKAFVMKGGRFAK